MTTGKSAQFSVFSWAKFLKNYLLQENFLRNKVLKIFCERDILRKLLCSKGLVTRDANTWSNFYSNRVMLETGKECNGNSYVNRDACDILNMRELHTNFQGLGGQTRRLWNAT